MAIKRIDEKNRTVEVLMMSQTVDSDNEILDPATANLSRLLGAPVLLHHKRDMIPIGKIIDYRLDTVDGVLGLVATHHIPKIEGNKLIEVVWESLKNETLKSTSAGYIFDEDTSFNIIEIDGENVLKIQGAVPVENSFVSIPALAVAGVLGVKDGKKDDIDKDIEIEKLLEEIVD